MTNRSLHIAKITQIFSCRVKHFQNMQLLLADTFSVFPRSLFCTRHIPICKGTDKSCPAKISSCSSLGYSLQNTLYRKNLVIFLNHSVEVPLQYLQIGSDRNTVRWHHISMLQT